MSITQTRVNSGSVQFMDSSTTVAAALSTRAGVSVGDATLNFVQVNGHNNDNQSGSNKYHGLELDGGRDNDTPIMRFMSETEALT